MSVRLFAATNRDFTKMVNPSTYNASFDEPFITSNPYITGYDTDVGARTALLLCCSQKEARTIRERAELQHRTISGYILNIVMRAVSFEEGSLAKGKLYPLNRLLYRTAVFPTSPRTAILLRCSLEESKRIRAAAKERESMICGFVLLFHKTFLGGREADIHPGRLTYKIDV